MSIPTETTAFAAALTQAQADLLQAAADVPLGDPDDALCAAAQIAAVRLTSAQILTQAAGLRDACQRAALAGDADAWHQRAAAVEAAAQAIRNPYGSLRELPLRMPGADEILWRLAAQTQGRFAAAKYGSQWAELALFELIQALVRAAMVLRQLTHDAEVVVQLKTVLAAYDLAVARDSAAGMVQAVGTAIDAAGAAFAGVRGEVERLAG